MASPWKFLSRLVATRRNQRPDVDEAGSAEHDAKKDAALKPISHTDGAEDTANQFNDRPSSSGVSGLEEVVAATPEVERAPTDELAADISAPADDPSPLPSAAHNKPKPPSQRGTRKSRRNDTEDKDGRISSDVSLKDTRTAGDALSLDEEIRALRLQLAMKLERQNAHLREMLSRFER